MTRWSAEGTHLGDFMEHAPTGKRVKITAIHMHQVVDGKIATLWEKIVNVFRQLGLAQA